MDLQLPSGTPAHLAPVDGARRGLVIIPDIWGLRPLFAEMCGDLAARTGWSVAAFEPFPGQSLATADDPAGYSERAAALRGLDDTALLGDATAAGAATGCDDLGIIGFCMGGMYALKASAIGTFDRAVSFYGMIRVPDDFAGPGQGQPLDALAERGDCEVMAVVGSIDHWTPPDDVSDLERAGVVVELYEGADHGFVHDPGRPAHRPEDAADAWDKALDFLRAD